MHVVPENPIHVQISLPNNHSQGVNAYGTYRKAIFGTASDPLQRTSKPRKRTSVVRVESLAQPRRCPRTMSPGTPHTSPASTKCSTTGARTAADCVLPRPRIATVSSTPRFRRKSSRPSRPTCRSSKVPPACANTTEASGVGRLPRHGRLLQWQLHARVELRTSLAASVPQPRTFHARSNPVGLPG